LVVKSLTPKSSLAAPRSPVDNCGKLTGGGDPDMTLTLSEQAAAVLNLIERGVIGWNEPDVVTRFILHVCKRCISVQSGEVDS
jgi:large subunit ribosomal protein L30